MAGDRPSAEAMSDQDRSLLAAACRCSRRYIDDGAGGQLARADPAVLVRLEEWVQHLDPDSEV